MPVDCVFLDSTILANALSRDTLTQLLSVKPPPYGLVWSRVVFDTAIDRIGQRHGPHYARAIAAALLEACPEAMACDVRAVVKTPLERHTVEAARANDASVLLTWSPAPYEPFAFEGDLATPDAVLRGLVTGTRDYLFARELTNFWKARRAYGAHRLFPETMDAISRLGP